MLGVIAAGHELAADKATTDTLYGCGAKLLSNFIRTYDKGLRCNTGKVKVRFKYHRFGLTKPRRTITRLKPNERAVVLLAADDKDNWKTVDYTANCSRFYVSPKILETPRKAPKVDDKWFILRQELLMHMSVPGKKTLDLYTRDTRDAQMFRAKGVKVTTDLTKLKNCKFSLVTTPNEFLLSVGYEAVPLVWQTFNTASRRGFDIKGAYIDIGDSTTRCYSPNAIMDRLSMSYRARQRTLSLHRARSREDTKSLNDIQTDFNISLISFALSSGR